MGAEGRGAACGRGSGVRENLAAGPATGTRRAPSTSTSWSMSRSRTQRVARGLGVAPHRGDRGGRRRRAARRPRPRSAAASQSPSSRSTASRRARRAAPRGVAPGRRRAPGGRARRASMRQCASSTHARHHRARRGSGRRCAGAAMRNWLPRRGSVDAEGAEREVARRLEQHRVEERHVDVLALAGAVAVAERRERREGGVEPGEVVAEEGRRLDGLAVGLAVEREEAARRLGEGVVAGALGVAAELAEAADRDQDHVGVHRAQLAVAEPEALERARAGSSRPRRRRRAARRRKRSRPAGLARGRGVRLRLLRFTVACMRGERRARAGQQRREPPRHLAAGCSTLTTSAPKSASTQPHIGPGPGASSPRATRTPARGPGRSRRASR